MTDRKSRSIAFPAPSHTTKASAANPTSAKAASRGRCGRLTRARQHRQNRDFKRETYDSSARAGKHHGADWNDRQQTRPAETYRGEARGKSYRAKPAGKSELHETGKMISVYERAEGIAALGERAGIRRSSRRR